MLALHGIRPCSGRQFFQREIDTGLFEVALQQDRDGFLRCVTDAVGKFGVKAVRESGIGKNLLRLGWVEIIFEPLLITRIGARHDALPIVHHAVINIADNGFPINGVIDRLAHLNIVKGSKIVVDHHPHGLIAAHGHATRFIGRSQRHNFVRRQPFGHVNFALLQERDPVG